MASSGSKPPYTFTEHNNQAKFVLIVDGLRVKRRLSNPLVKWPSNAQVLNQIINEQSINLGIELVKPTQKLYRFEIKRLPTPINPEKTKIKYGKDKVTIILEKRVTDTWSTFADTDFETIHLVKN